MQLLTITAVSLVLYSLYRFYRYYFHFIRPLTQKSASLPYPPKHWLLGNLIDHPGVNEGCMYWWLAAVAKCGKIFRLFHGLEPQLYLSHPDSAKEVLRSSEPKPLNIPGYGTLLPWLGRGLVVSEGDQWLRNRRLLTPVFHFEMLKKYLKVFNVTADKMVQRCGIIAQDGKPFDIFQPAGLFSLDTILRCAFSYDLDIQELGESQPIVKLSHEAITIGLKRCFNPFYWPEIIWWLSPLGRRYKVVCEEFNNISRDIISARKQELEDSDNYNMETKVHHDFLEILLKARDEDGKGLTEDEIRAEVNTFMFAGHDTTSSAISWTLYQLGKHPEHQAKCRAEINSIMQGREGDEMVWDDITKLNYLTMCIKETMRLQTTVPMISRYTTRDLEINGHAIPKGMLVNIMLFVIHMQPDVWVDPEIYRPDRFLPDEVAKRDTYAFVPFSAGPRNCIGQNFALNGMKVVLSKLIRNFRIGLDETRPPKRLPIAVLKTENGLWLTFEPIRAD